MPYEQAATAGIKFQPELAVSVATTVADPLQDRRRIAGSQAAQSVGSGFGWRRRGDAGTVPISHTP
jgi:hypothetical protein